MVERRKPESGPLSGLVVADFSRVLAGPYLTMTLGDLGADVVKVERPGRGDDTRSWGPPWTEEGHSSYYLGLNRNKRSITLDFSDRHELDLARRLAERADVLVENYRPGTLAKYGLDHETVQASNPALIYCSITGFGPHAGDLSGYDLLVQAMSGLMSVTGPPEGEPTKVGVALIDHIAALQGTVGVLAALRQRDRTGRGQVVEVSLMGSALAALLNQASGYLATGQPPARLGNRHPSIAPYQPFRASDGWIVVACGNDVQFSAFADACGLGHLTDDARFLTNADRVDHIDKLDDLLSEAIATRSVQDWVDVLNDAGVPAGPINDVGAAFGFADQIGLDPVVEAGSQRYVRSPIGLSETPLRVTRPAPRLGEHDEELRRWLEGG